MVLTGSFIASTGAFVDPSLVGEVCRSGLLLAITPGNRGNPMSSGVIEQMEQWDWSCQSDLESDIFFHSQCRPDRETQTGFIKENTEKLTDEDIAELKELAPDAAVLTSIECSDTDSTSDSDTETGDLPDPLVALYDANLRCLSQNELQERSEETFERLGKLLTNEQCVNLEHTTKNQAHSQAWHLHSTGRITSTTLHRVCTVVTESTKTNLVKQVMHYNKQELSHVPAVLWGRDMEDTARRQYTEIMKTKHQNFDVELCGLVVRPDKPHLGASLDGIANCTCCGKATVEITIHLLQLIHMRLQHLKYSFKLGDLRDETIGILKNDKQFLQEELVKKDSFIRELIKKNKERKPVRNTRGIIRRYLDTLEAFKKGKSMKAAFDAIGVDRNTIARTAIVAELHLVAPDVLKSMGQWNDKTETLSTFTGRCRSALTTEIK
ncbi:Inhibitor of growth [Labeo rohita]|uniref:Inhibitor of growth n=1 Tax=Labeo rohita TaxID=84645 RepID=A0A498MFC1_LABRO|nr:Inhibitor of growth [Labeo rohita]